MSHQLTILIILLLFWISSSTAAQDNLATVTIVNNSDETICLVLIIPLGTTRETFTNDMMHRLSMVPDTQEDFSVVSKYYSITLFDCANNLLQVWRAIHLTGSSTLIYPDTVATENVSAIEQAHELNIQGLRLYDASRYDEALAEFDEALAIARDVGDQPNEAAALNNIGLVYTIWREYEVALDYYTQALPLTREMGDRQGEATTLNNIANVYHDQGQYDQALDYYIQALTIRREIGDLAGESTTLNDIGLMYEAKGLYNTALDYFNQGLVAVRELNDLEGEGATLNNIGLVYDAQGYYKEALDYYNQALTIQREVSDQAGEGNTLSNIGLVYVKQGQYGTALDYLMQALTLTREVGDRSGEGIILNNIGGIYRVQGQDGKALDYYNQALTIARDVDNRAYEAAALNNIAGLYESKELYEKALDYYNQALAIAREVGDPASEGTILNNMGLPYRKEGLTGEALDAYILSLAIRREIGDREGEGITLNNIGLVYLQQGQYGAALDYLTQALAIVHEVGNPAGETFVLANRAFLNEQLGQTSNAIADYQAATGVSEQVVAGGALDTAIASLSNQPQNNLSYQRLAVLLAVQGDLAQALDYAERGRAILTRTELTNTQIDFRAGADQTLLNREHELRLNVQSAQITLDTLRQNNGSSADIIQVQEQLDKAQIAYDQHLETMQLQGGYLAREISFQTATLEQIQSVIPDDSTLLIYSIGDENLSETDLPKSVVFVVTRNSLDAVHLEVTEAELNNQVRAFAASPLTSDSALGDLYEMVFAPLADRITTSQLIIVPDGPLNYVPFGALFRLDNNHQRHYLIDDYTIRMVPSATTLWLLSEREPASALQPALVISHGHAPGFPMLSNAFSEAQQIAQLLGVEPIRDGTETQLREGVSGKGILHISAHAELNPFNPLYTVIYLGQDSTYDGRIEIREIYELDLTQGTQLVVLSGCETGSGGDGEDFGLLNRAFFAAGAQEVVASLWVVDDSATADLMVEFMRQRLQSEDDAFALRAAMLLIREKHPEPYFWSSFVLTGIG